jgi:hypothetical protein
VPSERHVARRTKGNREGKSTDDGSVYLKATRPDDTFVGMAKQQCPYCGQMFDDMDAHLRSSLPPCVLVTKNTVALRNSIFIHGLQIAARDGGI